MQIPFDLQGEIVFFDDPGLTSLKMTIQQKESGTKGSEQRHQARSAGRGEQ